MKRPILWNRCESAASLGASVVGENFSVSGSPTYAACKFGNGVQVNATTEIVQIVNTPATHDFAKGIIEMWIKLTVAIADGKNAGGIKPRVFTWWKDSNEYFQITFHNTLGLIWNVQDGSVNRAWNNTDTNIDIAANTPAHLVFAWNTAGIAGGANIRRMYVNGVAAGTNNDSFSDTDMTTAEATIGLLYNGSYLVSGETIIDNFKWYNTTDDLDLIVARGNQERFGLNDQLTS